MKDTGCKDRRKKEGDDKKQREKKPFDKKKYRLQKYSNKYKVNQWEERRKKAVLRGFYKELKREQQNSTDWSDISNNIGETSDDSKRKEGFYKAKQGNWRVKEDKKKRINEAICARAKREEALKKYKEKKMRTFQALSRKTKKGQPVMKGRIEMLLEKIQQNLT